MVFYTSCGSSSPTEIEIREAANNHEKTLELIKKYKLSFMDLIEMDCFLDELLAII